MARFLYIDLTGMDPPDIIETLDYETILDTLKTDMSARMLELGLDFDVSVLESEPAVKILEVAAYREVVLRARVNGAAKALLLALAQKNDLEHLGAWFGVERLVTNQDEIDEAEAEDEEAPDPTYETDDRLRTRIQLAPQAFGTAGAVGAYKFHVLTAAPNVKSVAITNPRPGYINIYPLVDEDDGMPDDDTLTAIRLKLNEDDIVPLTDIVTVARPAIEHVTIDVTLAIPDGPDPSALEAAALTSLQTYADARHKVGLALRLSGIYDAAHVAGVDHVIINEPTDDVDPGAHGAVYVEDIVVGHEVFE